MKRGNRPKYSKYSNQPFRKSEGKKVNLGSSTLKRRPITLAKVNLKEYKDDKPGTVSSERD